jgi:hypothetical protein
LLTRVKNFVFDIVEDLVAVLDGVSCRKLFCEGNDGLAYLTGDRSKAECVRVVRALRYCRALPMGLVW